MPKMKWLQFYLNDAFIVNMSALHYSVMNEQIFYE